jgi:peptide/nickel transport system substrate-binding protein
MRKYLLLLLAVVLIGVGACSDDGDDDASADDTTEATSGDGDDASAEDPVPGGTLTFGLASETSGYNPSTDQITLSGYQVAAALYDVLVAYDENAEWQPYLAESLEPNDDFTEWTITVRPDIEFHDGTPLDAAVLAQNLQATKDSPLLGQVFRAVETITAVDDRSVLVEMNSPWASFPHTLTAQPGLIVAPSVLEEPNGGQNPVGTGPFRLDRYIRDQEMVVTKNEDYWREGYPLLDEIEFRIIGDEVSRQSALEAGEIDIMEVRDANQVADFETRDDFVVYVAEEGEATETILFFNTAAAPFDEPVAREAVAYALDRDEISQVMSGGAAPPAAGPFKESSPWYAEGIEYPTLDLEQAEELAAEYEAETGEPLEFTMLVAPTPASQQLGSLIQQQLEQAGIVMSIETIEPTQLLLDILSGDYQMGGGDALFGSTHPDREYTFLHGDNAIEPGAGLGTGLTRIKNADVDEGLDAARTSDDQEDQAEGWAQVQQGLRDELAFLFLLHDDVGAIATPEVRDVLNWTLPDGEPGLPIEQNVVRTYQLWLGS